MMVKDIPDWQDQIAKGKFKNILQWMIDHVHSKGNMYYPQDLVKQVTGEGLNAKPFINYLETKYKRIYGA
jgi:carboxypeptidase Taq